MSNQISTDLPEGWFRAGSKPEEYLMGVDHSVFFEKAPGGIIKSLPIVNKDGFGTLMQNFFPKDFLGKRVRLSGFVKHKDIKGWAGMWMRVDTERDTSTLDNMSDRKIEGTGDWKEYYNVLDVPDDASNLAFGILLCGEGEAWLDNLSFSIVDSSVPVTVPKNPKDQDHPINLSF